MTLDDIEKLQYSFGQIVLSLKQPNDMMGFYPSSLKGMWITALNPPTIKWLAVFCSKPSKRLWGISLHRNLKNFGAQPTVL